LANSKYVWGINSAGGLSNECEAIHNEYWLELGDDKTRQDDNPEAETSLEIIYAGQTMRMLTFRKPDIEDLVRCAQVEGTATRRRATRSNVRGVV